MKKMESFDEHQQFVSANDENKNQNGIKCHGICLEKGSNEITTNTPRKKILGERNGDSNSSPNSPQKLTSPKQVSSEVSGRSDITRNHPFQVSPSNSSSSKISKSDLTFAPYDPMTNFLSPRPKFLRYNPSRHREILLKRERIKDLSSDVENQSETDQGESSGNASVSSSSSSPEGTLIKGETCGDSEENEGFAMEEEEEEEEMESFKGLKWAFKCLLVLAMLFASTVYISNMNSPTPPPAIQAIRGLGEECQRIGGDILKSLSEIKKFELGGRMFLGLSEFSDNVAVVDMEVAGDDVVEDEDRDEEVEEEEIAQQLGEVELDDSHVGSEENKEVSDALALYEENKVILEEVNLVENEIGKAAVQGFGEGFFQVVETEVVNDGKEEMTEKKNDIIIGEEVDEESESHGGAHNDESFEEEDEAKEEQKTTRTTLNEKYKNDEFTKNAKWVAVITLLVGASASLVLRSLEFNYKKETSSKTPKSAAEAAKESKRRTAACRPPTPPRPHKSVTPEVKLIEELAFGDVCSPSLPLSFGSEELMDSGKSSSSYGSFITEEKIAQKKEEGLSSTPVRRSMRIRSRKVSSP